MAENRIRKLGWLAPLALVAVGGLAACGDEDASETRTAPSAEASLGSDQHLYNQVAEMADTQAQRREAGTVAVAGSDVHLYNQVAEIADTQASSTVAGSDVHLYNQAAEVADTSGTDAGPNA